MEELARLKARISSLHDLQNIVHAIRGIAAARVQEAQVALSGIRHYVNVVEDAIGKSASLSPKVPAASRMDGQKSLDALIVVCSSHGFVGGYNKILLDHAATALSPGQKLGIIGERGVTIAQEKGLKVTWQFPMASYVRSVGAVARQVAEQLLSVSQADIVYAHYEEAGRYSIQSRKVLPLDPTLLVGAEQQAPPIHHLSPRRLLQELADEYLFAELTRAIMEGLASENGARMATMQAADHNISDKLEGLKKQEGIVRQEAVTVELLDVVTGAEAIQGENS